MEFHLMLNKFNYLNLLQMNEYNKIFYKKNFNYLYFDIS